MEDSWQPFPPIGGGQQDTTIIVINGIGFTIGDRVTVVIQGDGPNGVFEGRVVGIRAGALLLSLVGPPLPTGFAAGQIVAILVNQIAAIGRTVTTGL